MLAAAACASNAAIAADVGVHVDTVRKWRTRFIKHRLAGLRDLQRSGCPRRFTAVTVAQVKALACTLPTDPPTDPPTGPPTGPPTDPPTGPPTGPPTDPPIGPPTRPGEDVAVEDPDVALPVEPVPLSRWSSRELAAEVMGRGIVDSISPTTVRRWLARDAIKPWQHRSWIFSRDPDFAIKAARVLDLYARTWHGVPLGPDEYVISADEKSQLQALRRRHPDQPPSPGRTRRVEFEYTRGGTVAYFAAYDIHQAHVIGTIAPKTGIAPFADLVEKVMTTEPYASAKRVFWVVDNGSSHHGQPSIDRMQAAWPTAELVHLPVHASWLNQVEIYFSILQRKAIKPANFRDLDHLTERVLAFQARYNTTAEPFAWNYTRDDLNQFLRRIKNDTDQPRRPWEHDHQRD